MKISIVIPNFNGEIILRKNLSAVFKVSHVDEIIVVDDGSTDGSIETIKSETRRLYSGKELKIITNEKNLGFSSAVNRGVKESNGEVVVLLNTDVVPQADFLESLLVHFEDPQIFAVGCLDKSIENGGTVLRGRGVGRWERGFLVHSRGEVDKTDTLWVSGGSGAFRKELWEKLGGMDELYNPFYWEDIDLSYRAQRAGYKILFEPKSVVVHRHEKGIIKQRYSSSQVKTIAYRNQFIFVWKNIDDFGLLFDHLFWLPYHLINALFRLDWQLFFGFLKAVLLIPRVISQKSKYLTPPFLTDRQVLKKFGGY
ncbi:MAG: glycosyltransferase family 2 protein [bacterium]|nr:glycosyltransferase family 2 protein [bacterium]